MSSSQQHVTKNIRAILLKRIVTSMLLAGAFFGALNAHALDAVTVGLAIPPAVHDGAPYAAADKLGLFKEEGLDVKLIIFQGAGALIPQVASKRITFGYPTAEPVLSSYLNGGTPVPVRYFYNGVPANTMEFAVLASSPVKTLGDLKDKKIGVGALSWGTIPGSRAALREAGLKPGTNVEYVAVGALGAGFHALKTGAVDALNFNSSWDDMLELSGTPIRRIRYPSVFDETAGNGFIAHRDTFNEHPDLIVRFGRAYTKAQIVCQANPAFCVNAFWAEHPESKPQGDETKNLREAVELVKRRLDRVLLTSDGKPRQAGAYNLPAVRANLAEMQKVGEFPKGDVPIDQIFSNQFVPEFSRFDEAALRERARQQ
ncbi:ABC transporter substrate-binding protein [Burkholderia sp. PAMC 28687]|uniref:ABC transporter substrate-binding protein n=1 Tax=Burkholderia sp. PAMC 28687 TaxID=1795874 RepID=UPI000AC63151|nr:ABC transporter substrate-binding protein [Burkholderia sp. PAMC 28687]